MGAVGESLLDFAKHLTSLFGMLCKILRSPFQNAPPERFGTAFDSRRISPSNRKDGKRRPFCLVEMRGERGSSRKRAIVEKDGGSLWYLPFSRNS